MTIMRINGNVDVQLAIWDQPVRFQCVPTILVSMAELALNFQEADTFACVLWASMDTIASIVSKFR